MSFYVYKITNKINNKIYIGKTYNIDIRFRSHKTAAKRKSKNDYSILHRAIAKYGYDNFIIEELEKFELEQDALNAEINYINLLNSIDREIGYNMTLGGDGISGYKATDEIRRKQSELKKVAYLGDKNPFYGKHHTDETKQLIKDKLTGLLTGEKNPFYGKKHSEESLQKMRDNNVAKKRYFSNIEISIIRFQRYLGVKIKDIAKMNDVSGSLIGNIVRFKGIYSKIKKTQ